MFYAYNLRALPEDDLKGADTCWSCNILIVNYV